MYRHLGKNRTLKHNIKIAVILSFVAGIVNIVGFLSIHQLTTNVTGHFALFINDIANFKIWEGTVYLLYIFFFILGSFTSSFFIEKFKSRKTNILPVLVLFEATLLVIVTFLFYKINNDHFLASILLFAMGFQNSYVSKISNTLVRTTHLTGLFTDLGIDLSHLFFAEHIQNRPKLLASIKLRIYIILFFFLGGFSGGFFYSELKLGINTLILAASILTISAFFDSLKYRYIKYSRK
ncbi:MAG: DUF1275 domain-containing protein [Flavobacterium sp.]|nr:DUF1275 domain-containing protein [Flavobacterium sp.]